MEVDGDLNTTSQLQTHLVEECWPLILFKLIETLCESCIIFIYCTDGCTIQN